MKGFSFKTILVWIKNRISLVAFVGGFILDTLTLTRIDLLFENIVFITYLTVAFLGILLVHAVDTRRISSTLFLKARPFLPVLIQFPLGGLFSGFLIFYTKSASLFTSWPFVLILLTLFMSNELFRKRYEKLVFQVSLFYFALISYLVLIIPVILHTISTSTFIFSGIVSLICIYLLVLAIRRLYPKLYVLGARLMWMCIGLVYIGFHVLYFTNMIPPVPLALKEIGVFHSVIRTGNGYSVRFEKPEWYEAWRTTSGLYHRTKGEAAYCFSSVFAPTYLRTKVYHSWQRKTSDGSWIRESRIPFTIEGGRDGGYRGYTWKQNLSEGVWRCVVETENMQVIGQTTFNIVDVGDAVPHKEMTL